MQQLQFLPPVQLPSRGAQRASLRFPRTKCCTLSALLMAERVIGCRPHHAAAQPCTTPGQRKGQGKIASDQDHQTFLAACTPLRSHQCATVSANTGATTTIMMKITIIVHPSFSLDRSRLCLRWITYLVAVYGCPQSQLD